MAEVGPRVVVSEDENRGLPRHDLKVLRPDPFALRDHSSVDVEVRGLQRRERSSLRAFSRTRSKISP